MVSPSITPVTVAVGRPSGRLIEGEVGDAVAVGVADVVLVGVREAVSRGGEEVVDTSGATAVSAQAAASDSNARRTKRLPCLMFER
jgi:hypothetical protein